MALDDSIPMPCDGLSILNANPATLPGPVFLHELVARTSDDNLSAAIDFLLENGRRVIVSYPELHAASLALANNIACALKSETCTLSSSETRDPFIIPILSHQSPELYIAIMAALKVGGAFCPLNVDFPPDRVRFILEDVKAQVVLASRSLASKIPVDGTTCRVIFIDDVLGGSEAQCLDVVSHRELRPEDLAYVMYTSGTTGTPKGVAVSHLAATQSILAHERHMPPFSRFLQFAAPTFDVSIFEIFFPLFRGATLVGCSRAEMLTDLPGVLKSMEVDACELTPSVAGSMLRQRSRAPGLRLLLTIGEMLTDPVIQEFGGNETRSSMLWGMYGPTEASIHCTVQTSFSTAVGRNTIGTPLDTVSAFVIRIATDPDSAFKFEVLPAGEVGELALGGVQLATCYLNRAEQTAASFLNTPWGRVYRTGDKARIRSNGTIECLGRLDDSQIKLNGQRLELAEIEQVLLRDSGCHVAFATVISNVLVAFVAANQATPQSTAQLWDQCRSWLPAFMVPTDIVLMEELPLLPSGKVDRKRLVDDYLAKTTRAIKSENFMNDLERLLCEVASAVLCEQVSPLTALLMAKMDSLAAIEYASLLREKGISVTPFDILSIKTPRELRQRLDKTSSSLHTERQSTFTPAFKSYPDVFDLEPTLEDQIYDIDHVAETTVLQQSMIAETLKGTDLYINQIKFELASNVTIEVLRSSFKTLAKYNEILRTGFAFAKGELCQVIWRELDDAQLYHTGDGNSSEEEIKDIESFLLRPLRIEFQDSTSPEKPTTLLLTLHHAIYDGWTVDLIIEDLSLLLCGEEPVKRPQFSRIMRHLRDSHADESIDSMEFWTDHLRGVGATPSSDFRTTAVCVPRRVVSVAEIPLKPSALKEFMLRVSVGPQVLFQACVIWLWSAVQGVEDITIGCVSSGRTLPLTGIEKIMGPCMATLPFRIDVAKYRTIFEFLQGVHSINREILQHGHIPLVDIYKAASIPTSARLFDIIFSYQESLAGRKQKSNSVREIWHRDATEAKLVVEIQPCEDRFVCQMTYQTDVLPQPLVEAFTRHLVCLIDFVSSHVEAPVNTISQCFPFDSLSHFNDKPRSIDTYSTLAEMVENSASRFPSATALHFVETTTLSAMDSTTLSYHELNSKANQIARHLLESIPTCKGVVAIIMDKSPLLYCSILGILKTGCAYLPILPSTPIERIKVILGQAEPCLCVVDTRSSTLVSGEGFTGVNIEIADLSPYSSVNLGVCGTPSDLAYVIYTSGTTGTPKGVAVTNKNILSNVSTLSDIYPYDRSSRMLQACSQAFDVSVFEIFFTWANGMCLCAATNDTLFEDFEGIIRSLEITHLSLTVTVASLLNPERIPTVRFLVTSGEPMIDDVFEKWSQHLYQGYGPSETTNICTVRKVSKGDSPHFLGWSFENTSTFVLHPASTELVPVGCIGELCFGGDQVAYGYLKLPEATAGRFIDHPKYGRIYRSGDLGRMLPDGSLLIHGRIDTQVKLRGLRIELDEIQAISLKTGLTRACKCILVTTESAKLQQLAFFYVPLGYDGGKFRLLPLKSYSKEQISKLHQAFRARLPDYMVPAFIFPISEMPMTSSGKVDESMLRSSVEELSVSALSPHSSSATENQIDNSSDWSETESLIASAIMDQLKKDGIKISRWTTFAALGLDSISAMPVARKLQHALRRRVPLSLLLQNPSVGRLASAIDKQQALEASTASSSPLLPEVVVQNIQKSFASKGLAVSKVLPCTPLQQAMVMSSLSSSPAAAQGKVSYFNQIMFRLRLPFETMMAYWNEIIRRHEILRACFTTSDNIRYPTVQVILDNYTPEWQVLEIEATCLQERAAQHLASVSVTANQYEPPISLAILRTNGSGEYLSFVCHHAMYDGISMRIILSEIEALHKCEQLPEPLSLEPFLREMQQPSPGCDKFWIQQFSGFHSRTFVCENVTGDTKPRGLSLEMSSMPLELIEHRLRDLGVSMLALVQASWAITLSIASQTSDVSFGNVVNGRSVALDKVDDLVAPCFNTLPLRMNLSGFTFLLDVMKGFQKLNAQVMLHQFTSLRNIQNLVEAQTGLFDTLVILQPPTTPLDDSLWSLVSEDGVMDIPVVCEVVPSGLQEAPTIQLHRDESKVSYQTLQLISKILKHVIDACLQYPSSHVPTIKVLPADWQNDIQQLTTRLQCASSSNNLADLEPDSEEIWSPMELVVRRTLAQLVEMPEEQVDRLTPIFRYGLDSLGAIQLAMLLRHQDVSVSATDVMGHPTCAGIASAITHTTPEEAFENYDSGSFQRQVEGELTQHGVDIENVQAVLPCTSTQQGILSQFLNSNGRSYFNYSSWEIEAMESDFFLQGWFRLKLYHQVLRTGFVPVSHPDSSFAMLVYSMNPSSSSISTYTSYEFDVEKWLSDGAADALHMLAHPPWRLAVVRPDDTHRKTTLTIHLAIHHALYDAFTLRHLLHDLTGILTLRVLNLKPLALSRAVWHHVGLVRSSQSAGETFWKPKGDDFVFHKFPVMTPLHVVDSSTLTVSHTCVASSSRLRQSASKAGVTLQAALQAAWTRLLSTYTGESRVTFGVVLDGRVTELAQESMLPMIVTLPVIAENTASNTALLQQMMQYNSGLRRCQFMPISQVRRCLGVSGSMFDTLLIYQAVDRTTKRSFFRIVEERSSVEYPVSLEVEESFSDTTQLNLTFESSILPKEQAILLLHQFEAILAELLLSIDYTTFDLPSSRPELFSVLPAQCETLPTDKFLLHELVEESSQLIPSELALEFTDNIHDAKSLRRWTYQELDDIGNQVAHFIIDRGVRPGAIIATCFDKCPIAYFTLLGILKAGCAFLCLDPSSPATRQTFILDDSNAAMLLLGKEYDWTHEASLPVYMIDENTLSSLPKSRPSLQRQVLPSDSCYCLYTSGTTGTPKGCLMSHENVVQAMAAFKDLFAGRWKSDSRWLQFAAFHFDVSVLEQYWSWYVGIAVVAVPKDVILSDLAGTISKLEITHIDLTPSLARLITPDECPTLCKGVFITGGEKLRSDILETWGSKRVIYNAYGPTETTIGITMHRGVPQNGRPSNIGNLFLNVGAYVFEPNSETPVLRGGVGELCVSGKLVGKGYLNREQLTEERFPVLKKSGERIYRTGDLVRVLYDDSLDFLGRADDQVKLRGQRLEFGEINHAIQESLVNKTGDVTTIVTRRRGQQSDMLVSFVALSTDAAAAVDLQVFYDANHIDFARQAREACRARLATYMVPTFILCISRIPLSTNNKVDVNRLKKLFSELSNEQIQSLSVSSSEGHRPLNRLENQVLEAICQVVHVQETDISPITTIYQLGVDSITATRVAKRLRAVGFSSATASLILQHPEIGALSQALSRLKVGIRVSDSLQVQQTLKALRHQYIRSICEALEVNASEVEYVAPCTPLQQGMIAISKGRQAQSAYFNQFHLCLDSDVSVERMKEALSRVIASYPILRTAFVETPDGFVQVAIKNRPLRWFDIETDTELLEMMIVERKRLWTESNDPVMRWPVEVDYIQETGNNHILLKLFHGVYDAHSLGLIFNTLKSEYCDLEWSPGPTFLSVLLQGPLLGHKESHQFWKSLLVNHHFQPMPSLLETLPDAGTTFSNITRLVVFDGLETRRKTLQVTHQTLLQAAWLQTLRRYFVNPPTIGIVLSGRSLAIDDIDLVVGPLFNTLPFRVDFTNDISWISLARKIQECNNGLLPHVHTPLRDIQKLCADGQPLFDTLFTFYRDDGDASKDEKNLWSIEDHPADPDYPLAIEVILTENDTLRVTLVAQAHIADELALNSLFEQFVESLNSAISASDDAPLASVSSSYHASIGENASHNFVNSVSQTTVAATSFEWNKEAYDIRRELVALSGVDEKDVSESTNLFALGLDSIDMIKLAGRLTRLGYSVSMSTLMKQPTLESVVNSVKKATLATTNMSSTSDLDRVVAVLQDYFVRAGANLSDVEAFLPPTPLQDSMVAEMVRSDFHTYFNHDVLEIPSDIDVSQLKGAISRVYADSPILRTAFLEVDEPQISSAYCQVVRSQELEFAPALNVSSMDDIPVLTDKIRFKASESRGTANLFQVHFVELGTKNFIVLSIAHALYDGWSLHMLHRDIQAAYEGTYAPRPSYTPYLSRMLFSPDSSARQFWTDLLDEAQATLLPERHVTPRDEIVYRFEKSSKRSSADIRALCRRLHVTPQVLGQACWAAVLASLIKSLDVVFGVVLSGRDTEEAQGLMFPTMNTVPLRLALHGTVSEFLEYCQHIMSSVVEFQHTPLREIQKLAPGAGGRLFNSLFLLQNVGDSDPDVGILKSQQSVSAVDYPVCAELELLSTDSMWRVACDGKYMSQQDAENLETSLDTVLDFFAGAVDTPVLKFESSDCETVSICGLEQVVLTTTSQNGETIPPSNGRVSKQDFSASERYQFLLDVLSELSQVSRDEINLDLSIFHLGLDSISAIKASSMLRKRGFEISTRDLVTLPSIHAIVDKAELNKHEKPESHSETRLHLNSIIDGKAIRELVPRAGLDEKSVETVLPCLPMQALMLSVWQNTAGTVFFPKFSFKIVGSTSLTTISRAWITLVDEVAMLRTHLISTTSSSPPFLQVILKSSSARERATHVTNESNDRWELIHAATPFALAHFEGQEGEASLHLYIHHALYDAVSLAMILNRFGELCDSTSPVAAPAHSIPWFGFATKHLSPSIQSHREQFWTSYLRGNVSSQLYTSDEQMTDSPNARVNEFRSNPLKNTATIKSITLSHGISTQVLLLAIYAKAMSKSARREDDYVFGIYLGNRAIYPDLETTPFPTLNILPLRVRDPLGQNITTIASNIQRDITEISKFENSTASLFEIQKWAGVRIDTAVNILPRTQEVGSGGVKLEKMPDSESSSPEVAKYLITPDHESLLPNKVAQSYMDVVDIEMLLHEDMLDLGVFGPASLLTTTQAHEMIVTIMEEIEVFKAE